MLIRFEIENYKSFFEKASFSTNSRNKGKTSELFYLNTFKNDRTNDYYLKSSVLIGKNAGGKSNFVSAIKDFIFMIANSFSFPNTINRIQPFRLIEKNEKPTIFVCEFLEKNNWYRYSFGVLNKKISYERLEIKVKTWADIFSRTSSENNSIHFPKKYNSKFNKLLEHTKESVLFFSVLNQFNVDFAKKIFDYFIKNYTIVTPEGITRDQNVSDTEDIILDNSSALKKRIIDFIKSSDFGITNMSAKTEPIEKDEKIEKLAEFLKQNDMGELSPDQEIKTLMFSHNIYDKDAHCKGDFSFDREFISDGTNRMVDLAGAIFYTLENGGILVIDEIEHKLHHLLVRKIIELFDSIDINPLNAQLVFTSHDILILEEGLRRDQIWIVDKTACNQSKLYNLLDIPGVTKKTNILKQYLLGIYRGIPDMFL
jgi:hypothetical protein